MRHMHGAEAHICSAVQPKHAQPCGIAIHMKGSARQRKTNMEKDNMNDELLGGLPESDADGAEYEEVYIEEELENGEPADDELTDDEDYTEISYETLVMTDRDSHRAIIPDELSRPEDLLRAVVRVLDSKKARGLKVLRVADKTVIADYFVMCTGTSNTQLRALSGELEERLAEVGVYPGHIEGYNEASWIIMDYASVIVHIFDRETRNFYNLEKLWGDAEEIDIDSLLVD